MEKEKAGEREREVVVALECDHTIVAPARSDNHRSDAFHVSSQENEILSRGNEMTNGKRERRTGKGSEICLCFLISESIRSRVLFLFGDISGDSPRKEKKKYSFLETEYLAVQPLVHNLFPNRFETAFTRKRMAMYFHRPNILCPDNR